MILKLGNEWDELAGRNFLKFVESLKVEKAKKNARIL